MAKKKSFIRSAARWVSRMFGYKAENKFARGVWYVFATSAAVVFQPVCPKSVDFRDAVQS